MDKKTVAAVGVIGSGAVVAGLVLAAKAKVTIPPPIVPLQVDLTFLNLAGESKTWVGYVEAYLEFIYLVTDIYGVKGYTSELQQAEIGAWMMSGMPQTVILIFMNLDGVLHNWQGFVEPFQAHVFLVTDYYGVSGYFTEEQRIEIEEWINSSAGVGTVTLTFYDLNGAGKSWIAYSAPFFEEFVWYITDFYGVGGYVSGGQWLEIRNWTQTVIPAVPATVTLFFASAATGELKSWSGYAREYNDYVHKMTDYYGVVGHLNLAGYEEVNGWIGNSSL